MDVVGIHAATGIAIRTSFDDPLVVVVTAIFHTQWLEDVLTQEDLIGIP